MILNKFKGGSKEPEIPLDQNLAIKLNGITKFDIFAPEDTHKCCAIRYTYIGEGLIGLTTADAEKLVPFLNSRGLTCKKETIQEGMQEYNDYILFPGITDKDSLVTQLKNQVNPYVSTVSAELKK